MLYVLGIASTAFSREHETRLFGYVRAIPASHVPLWLGKVGFSLASTLTLAVLLSAFTAALWWLRLIELDFQVKYRDFLFGSALWLLGMLYIAGIGTLCSQLVKHPFDPRSIPQ